MAQDAVEEVQWFGLFNTDATAASRFCAELNCLGGSYTSARLVDTRSHEGALIAGSTEIEARDESTWMAGVVVTDLEASLSAARRLGGHVLVDVSRAEGLASWAVIDSL